MDKVFQFITKVRKRSAQYAWLLLAICISTILKIWLLAIDAIPFNGDEAVVALMARHILQGARPIFFYGQAYMGSLDAWLVAGAFTLFGESVLSVRLVQVFLFTLYLISLWIMLRRFFFDQMIADIAVILAAIPPVLLTTYTLATLGGYLEILILGNLVLLLGYEVVFGRLCKSTSAWFLLGFLGGLGFWILGMMGVYLFALGLIGLWKFSIKNWSFYLLAGAGFLIGSSPWWLYNFAYAWAAVNALIQPGANTSIIQHLVGFLVLGIPTVLGFRLPWANQFEHWLILGILLLLYQIIILSLIKIIRSKGSNSQPGVKDLLVVLTVGFIVVFIISDFGFDASGRYLLPLYVLFFTVIALAITNIWRQRKWFGSTILILFLTVFGFQTWQAANSPDKITTQVDPITRFDNQFDQELINFLKEQNELVGYSNYWVSYRLAFLSEEEIIFAPRLPYKDSLVYDDMNNRYPLYDEMIAESSKVAYITSKHPVLDDLIQQTLAANGISYSEKQIGAYHIFYNLSEDIRPENIQFIRE